MLKVGEKLPEFTLETDSGATVSTKDLAGRRFVLFVYPKAGTPG